MNMGLEGFVLFKNDTGKLTLSVSNSAVRVSQNALKLIGNPTHVNVFFDEMHKRMAIKAADEKTMNAFPVIKVGLGCHDCLRGQILDIIGMEQLPVGWLVRFVGVRHPSAEYIIFDLSQPRREMCRTYGRKPTVEE